MKIDPTTKKIFIVSISTSVASILICVGLILNYKGLIYRTFTEGYLQQAQDKGNTTDSNKDVVTLATQQSLVVGAVKKANPAVVSVIITKDVPKYETYYENIDPFGDFFNSNPFGNLFQVPQMKQNGTEKKEVGGGSGFLVTKDGLIITNRHVVEDTKAEYTVFTNDGKKHSAKVVARDAVMDIAVLKIDGAQYPYLELGNSDTLDLGQSVIAIGNALGEFKNSVSVGVISGLSRSITAGNGMGQSEALEHVIQTDAAINPGNSGGPLVDLGGRVIGVNVAVAQGSENIGFALPINSIKSVIDSVRTTGKIVRPYLGVRYVSITDSLKEKNNLSVNYGVLVKAGSDSNELAVVPGSPADKAGIVENDIILEIDGIKLDENTSLANSIRSRKIGETISLKILHRGEEKTVTVKLEAAPNE